MAGGEKCKEVWEYEKRKELLWRIRAYEHNEFNVFQSPPTFEMSETMWTKIFWGEGELDLILKGILWRKGKYLGQEHDEFENVWFITAASLSK